jgi:hypothetical protein
MLPIVLSRKISPESQTEAILESKYFPEKLPLSSPEVWFLERKLNTIYSGQGAKGYI